MKVTIRIRNVFAYIFNNIVQIRAYALMALGRNISAADSLSCL